MRSNFTSGFRGRLRNQGRRLECAFSRQNQSPNRKAVVVFFAAELLPPRGDEITVLDQGCRRVVIKTEIRECSFIGLVLAFVLVLCTLYWYLVLALSSLSWCFELAWPLGPMPMRANKN